VAAVINVQQLGQVLLLLSLSLGLLQFAQSVRGLAVGSGGASVQFGIWYSDSSMRRSSSITVDWSLPMATRVIIEGVHWLIFKNKGLRDV
jgi:hypothetical protein